MVREESIYLIQGLILEFCLRLKGCKDLNAPLIEKREHFVGERR